MNNTLKMKPTRIDEGTLHRARADVGLGHLPSVTIVLWNWVAGKDVLLTGVCATKFLKYKSIVLS